MNKKPYFIASFFLIIDFISKIVIVKTMTLHKSIELIPNFFYLTYTQNKGAAFSILEDQRILFLLGAVLCLFVITKFIGKQSIKGLELVSYSMIIGGILGNFVDRLFYGYVIDFLDFRFWGYYYPIFNFADTFIVIGIILMIIYNYRKEHYGNKRSNS